MPLRIICRDGKIIDNTLFKVVQGVFGYVADIDRESPNVDKTGAARRREGPASLH